MYKFQAKGSVGNPFLPFFLAAFEQGAAGGGGGDDDTAALGLAEKLTVAELLLNPPGASALHKESPQVLLAWLRQRQGLERLELLQKRLVPALTALKKAYMGTSGGRASDARVERVGGMAGAKRSGGREWRGERRGGWRDG